MEFLEVAVKPMGEILKFVAPLWIAVAVGVLVGWVWRPNWVPNNGHRAGNDKREDENSTNYESLLSFASYVPSLNSIKLPLPSWISDDRGDFSGPSSVASDCSASTTVKVNSSEKSNLVNNDDLDHLCRIVEEKDGGPAWIQMMDRSMPTMDYQAWRRDPESGPPQYRSRTVFQNAVPEIVRDFFWDDEFRAKWDDMLLHASTLEECAVTGTMQVQWIRKFPFFCSDREYIIGRRIWESGRSYYCVTKGVPCDTVARRNKPRRVDLYYSSWLIRAVESKNGDGLTACEVLLFHHEDMGIPWEIAKLGVRQGMWGAVKKIEPGLRAYQKFRASGAPISRSAFMAQINTKVSADYLSSLESSTSNSSEAEIAEPSEKPVARNIPKMLVLGGAVVLACSIDRGLLTKAVIFGVARRFANMGKRL